MSGDSLPPDAAPLLASLRRMKLVGAHQSVPLVPLEGGVSSDIYRAELPGGPVCVKRALPKLRVAADWQAPIGRNRYEVAWMRMAAQIVPHAVPAVVGEDPDGGAFAMSWLPPDRYPVWKTQLRDGTIDPGTAAAVGDVLGRIHAATADRADVHARFPTNAIFYAIRLEPYLAATGRVHPDLAERLDTLVAVTQANARVLVHGDFSPKNLVIGPDGPVILDAECAWYGDPAFDVAFVLNHLLLKGVWRPAWRAHYLASFLSIANAYFRHVAWEPIGVLEARVAALLPGLLLARVDGKSPAEYVTASADKERIRAFARGLLQAPVTDPRTIAQRWLG